MISHSGNTFTIYMYTKCTVHSAQCTQYTLHSTHSTQYTHSAQCTQPTIHTVHTVHTAHSAHSTQYTHSAQCTEHFPTQCTVHCALCTAHSPQPTAHGALSHNIHSAQCTAHSPRCSFPQCTQCTVYVLNCHSLPTVRPQYQAIILKAVQCPILVSCCLAPIHLIFSLLLKSMDSVSVYQVKMYSTIPFTPMTVSLERHFP